MTYIWKALALFRSNPDLRKHAIKPWLWGAFAYLIVLLATTLSLGSLGSSLSQRFQVLNGLGGFLGGLLGFVIFIAFGGAIYLALVSLLAGFGFDALTTEVERKTTGKVIGQPLTFSAGISDGISRALLAGVAALISACLSSTLIVPLFVAAFVALLDMTASPLLRRGVPFRRQFGVARAIPGAVPFALTAGFISLVPFLNVLALPVLVAAGTLLVLSDGRSSAA